MQRLGVLRLRAVVREPGLLGDVGADRDRVRGHRRVADGVRPGAAVARRDEDLDVVLGDRAVVELRAGVVAVVERRQAADRDVDDVGAVAGRVDDAVDQAARGAGAAGEADLDRQDLRARGRAVHLAAEQVVAGGDARDVRAVLGAGDADADVARLVGLDDEGHPLGDVGRRVVGAEVADVVLLVVVGHRLLVGEVAVAVEVDADLLGHAVEQHAPGVGAVAVAVDVTAGLAVGGAQVARGLAEHAEGVRAAGRRRRPALAVGGEGAGVGLGGLLDPGAVAGVGGVGVVPVDDLALAVAGGRQRGGVEVDARVEHRDGGVLAVPVGQDLAELRRVGVAGGQVRVDARGVLARGRLRQRGDRAVGLRVVAVDEAVDVDGLDRLELRGLLRLLGRDGDLDVVELGVGGLDDAAERLELVDSGAGLALLRRDQQRDVRLPGLLGFGDECAVVLVEGLAVGRARGRRGQLGGRHGNGDAEDGSAESGGEDGDPGPPSPARSVRCH